MEWVAFWLVSNPSDCILAPCHGNDAPWKDKYLAKSPNNPGVWCGTLCSLSSNEHTVYVFNVIRESASSEGAFNRTRRAVLRSLARMLEEMELAMT